MRKIGTECAESILSKSIVKVVCEMLLDADFCVDGKITVLEIIAILLKQFQSQEKTGVKARGSMNKSSMYFGKCLAKVKSIELDDESI